MTKAPDWFAAAYGENNPGEAMPGVCCPLRYRFAGGARRSNGEAGEAITRRRPYINYRECPQPSATSRRFEPALRKVFTVP